MAYRVIDDDTALEIYDAIQKSSNREIRSYNRLLHLPKHKITGEVVFYLDELLDFAEREMAQDPAETLASVIDAGIVSWYGNLDDTHQKKLGLDLNKEAVAAPTANVASENLDDSDEVEELREQNRVLSDELEELRAEHVAMRREISRLQIANDELLEQISSGEPASVSLQPAYLNDSMESRYTEMTSHLLANNGRGGEAKAAKAGKKSKQSRRHR